MDIRVERMARLLTAYSINVQPGDRVAIVSSPLAEDWVLAVYEQVLARGGHPIILMSPSGAEEIFYRVGSDAQLTFIDPVREMLVDQFEGYINIRATANTRELSAIDPQRQAMHRKAMEPVMQRYMERGAAGEFKWNGTQYPTNAAAQDADMSLRDYTNFVFQACHCDKDDPVAEWQRIHDEQEQVIAWLRGRDQVKVIGPNADLTLSIKDRVFVNSDGHNNMPSGEVFTGPVEDSATGWVRFTYPAVTGGREVTGIELKFEAGKVVEATAKKNAAYLLHMLDTDAGARYLGEFAIGTNFGIQQFTKNILFDEKIGGSFHMAVGAGYPETGSQNRSAIHWDMICDMRDGGEIWVDGDLLYQNGKFVI